MSEPYCDWSDMPKAYCAHCRGLTLDTDLTAEADELGKVRGPYAFQAMHPGVCADCGEKFPKGTTITKYGAKYAHKDCEDPDA